MRAIVLFCLLSAFPTLSPARAAEPYIEVERRFTADQMRATGLDTLSPEQLALLNRLLRDTQGQAVEDARAQGRAEAEIEAKIEAEARRREAASRGATETSPGPGRFAGLDEGAIRSRIVGDVADWQPGDVFVLDNGQQWKVLKGSYRLRTPLTSPDVRLVPGVAGRWFLEFDEALPKARVYRID